MEIDLRLMQASDYDEILKCGDHNLGLSLLGP